ncbi:MAG: hypothetical protein KXJ50_01430 [Vulcanococcus sp.]|jgi:hypothetical protein|uniref:hypothetical protein n=1 Tax=Vulcanococcus sp. TaxID=2856995 RepID=UPI0025D247DA|nr:hypothetical protein [Vulcanococcus sp.]MBW0175183.1 hypothetical protein [Vulcanococcus sp.]MBW0179717.1 hypothetical protein [Vulcanococcus sp.]
MTTKVLLTHHHRDAIENAAERGFWMPLLLEAEQLKDVMYLTSLSYGETTLKQLVEVASFEPWRESDGIERWLPFLGQRLELPQPLPLGDRRLLSGWLPRQREAVQIVELDALLAAERLSDVLPGSGACCHLPRRPELSAVAGAVGRRGLAA